MAMATPFPALPHASFSWVLNKRSLHSHSYFTSKIQKTHLRFSPLSNPSSKRFIFFVKAEEKNESSSSVAVASEDRVEESLKKDVKLEESGAEAKSEIDSDAEATEKERQQELDWKTDEDFKKFTGNPSIEAAIKLEKKMTDRKLKELDRETSDNPIVVFFNNLARDNLSMEKERLEKAEESFKALDLNKACVVQPKAEMDLQFESTNLSNVWGYFSAIFLCITTFETIALTSGFFLKPDATIDDYLRDVVPLFGGFLTILGVSEVCFALVFTTSSVCLMLTHLHGNLEN